MAKNGGSGGMVAVALIGVVVGGIVGYLVGSGQIGPLWQTRRIIPTYDGSMTVGMGNEGYHRWQTTRRTPSF